MNKKEEALKVLQPGCDRLTDPSEIAALGKYLKSKKDALQDSITLSTEKTATSGLKNDFRELSEDVQKLGAKQITSLEKEAALHITGKEIESLSNQRVEAESNVKNNTSNKLSGNLETLEGSREERLSTRLEEAIGDKKSNNLSEKLEGLRGGDSPELEKSAARVSGNLGFPQELNQRKERVFHNPTNNELEEKQEKVVGEMYENFLDPTLEKLGDTEDNDLSSFLEILGIGEETLELSTKATEVGGKEKEVERLEGELISLEAQTTIPDLNNTPEKVGKHKVEIETLNPILQTLQTKDDPSLSEKKEGLGKPVEVDLSSKREDINEESHLEVLGSEVKKTSGDRVELLHLNSAPSPSNIEEKEVELGKKAVTINTKPLGDLSDAEALDVLGVKKETELSLDSRKVTGEKKDPTLHTEKEIITERETPDLKQNAEVISGSIKNPVLGDTLEKIDADLTIEKLGDQLESIVSDKEEDTQLSGTQMGVVGERRNIFDELPTTTPEQVKELGDNFVNLRDDSDIVIGEEREVDGLENGREIIPDIPDSLEKLEDKVEIITDIPESESLSEHLEKLEDTVEVPLSEHKEILEKKEEPELSLYKDNLEDTRENSLSDIREDLEKPEDIGLSEVRENLTDDRENGLSEHKETLQDNRESKLSEYKESLGEIEDNELSNVRTDLGETKDIPLSETIQTLQDTRENNLSNIREDLEKPEDIGLSEVRENLTDEREGELSEFRDDIITEDIESLSDFLDTLGEMDEQPLSGYRENLKNERESNLSNVKLELTDDRDNSLSDFVEDLEDERNPELYTNALGLERNSKTNLGMNLIKDDEPGGDDYEHKGWTGVLDERKPLENEEDGHTTTFDPTTDTLFNDTLGLEKHEKINLGKNLIKDEEGSPAGDDYEHKGWDGTLDKRVIKDKRQRNKKVKLEESLEKVEKNDTTKINEGRISDYEHSKYAAGGVYTGTPWEKDNSDDYAHEDFSKLGSEKLTVQPEDGKKINTSRDPIKEGSPAGDTTKHTGWDGTLDERLIEGDDENTLEDLYEGTLGLEVHDKTNVEGDVHEGWKEVLDKGRIGRGINKNDKALTKDEEALVGDLIKILESRGNLQEYYTNILHFAQNKDLSSGWGSKVAALMSAYLSSDNIGEERLKEFEKQLYSNVFTEYAEIEGVREGESKELENLKDTKAGIGVEGRKDINKVSGSSLERVIGQKKDVTLKRESQYVAKYKLNWCWQEALDLSQYLRWVAEKATFGSHGSLRALLLDSVLMTLVQTRMVAERLSGANRDRLPGGSNVLGAVVGATQGNLVENAKAMARKAAKAGVKALNPDPNQMVDKTFPLNRPKDRWTETKSFQSANNRLPTAGEQSSSEGGSGGSLLKSIGKAIAGEVKGLIGISSEGDYDFNKYYTTSKAMIATLRDLCGTEKVSSLEELKNAIESSPVMTSASKVTTTSFNNKEGKVTTLDDNSNWEILLFPYLGKSNGEVSYLPSIEEINAVNKLQFGLSTAYGIWMPITSFELSKSKIVSKTLQLYNGEISYPVGMESTNDLRITIADDQYKSWRRYFEMCANCAIYNSTLHDIFDYTELTREGLLDIDLSNGAELNGIGGIKTKIDKTFICPAPYKNITFRCVIYCMTPQKETIDKYDLLVVMKDFSEERTGDVEPGGSDLTVSFSIVGENPTKEATKDGKMDLEANWKERDAKAAIEKAADKAALATSIAQVGLMHAVDGALDMI